MLIRQRGIEREVAVFMRSLWSERRSLTSPPDSAGEWLHRELLVAWAAWQRVLNSLLRGPIGRSARRMLSRMRGIAHRANAGSEPDEALPSRAVD
jgi:hypothetical protein